MKAGEIFAKLDEIRALVERNSEPDGTVKIDPTRVYIATEFCLKELRSALEGAQNKDYRID